MTAINAFLTEEHGAVTTDWVVLIAVLIGLALTVVSTISGGVENLTYEVAEDFASIEPISF